MLPIAVALFAGVLSGPGIELSPFDPFPDRLAASWDQLSPDQQDKAIRNYGRYLQMPDEKRRSVDKRYEKWRRLRPEDQERFRHRHEEYRGRGLVDDD
jgi:hypothetical protein